jgi:hypothetical protein
VFLVKAAGLGVFISYPTNYVKFKISYNVSLFSLSLRERGGVRERSIIAVLTGI